MPTGIAVITAVARAVSAGACSLACGVGGGALGVTGGGNCASRLRFSMPQEAGCSAAILYAGEDAGVGPPAGYCLADGLPAIDSACSSTARWSG